MTVRPCLVPLGARGKVMFHGVVRALFGVAPRVLVLVLLASLASCVKPTVYPRYLTVADVINNVKCELYDAILLAPNAYWLKAWEAHFTVTLQVFRQGCGSGELALVVPYDLGSSTIGLAAGLEKSGKSRIAIDFDADKNLEKFMARDQCVYSPELRKGRNLAGETGLGVWFGETVRGINRANIEKQTKGITYNLEFITTLDGSIKPAFGTEYPSGRMFGGTFEFKRRREDTNTLTVAFAKYEPPVAFADSDLGLALGGIRLALEASQAREDVALRNFEDASAGLRAAEQKSQNALKGQALRQTLGQERSLSDQARSARLKSFYAQNPGAELTPGQAEGQLRTATERKRSAEIALGNARRETRRIVSQAERDAARLRWLRAPGPQVSTRQTIDQLLLRDAIRDIPRR